MRVQRARVVVLGDEAAQRGGDLDPRRDRAAAARAPRARPSRSRGARRGRPPPRAARPPTAARPRSPSPSAFAALAHYPQCRVSFAPGILARGPWQAGQVAACWSDEPFEPTPERAAAADRAIAALADRGSPSHDGLAARLAGFERTGDGLRDGPAADALVAAAASARTRSASLAALCVVRDSEGRWLAGRRAAWVASWAGRWALGAGGAVEVGEDPTQTLTRELAEEWSVEPERETVEALVCLPNRHGDADRPGLAGARERRSRATPSTTRTPGGRATSTLARRGRPARCGTWRGCSNRDHLHTPQVPLVRPLGDLPHAARAGDRGRAREALLRLGARHRLDRHLAAVHRRRAAARASRSGSP